MGCSLKLRVATCPMPRYNLDSLISDDMSDIMFLTRRRSEPEDEGPTAAEDALVADESGDFDILADAPPAKQHRSEGTQLAPRRKSLAKPGPTSLSEAAVALFGTGTKSPLVRMESQTSTGGDDPSSLPSSIPSDDAFPTQLESLRSSGRRCSTEGRRRRVVVCVAWRDTGIRRGKLSQQTVQPLQLGR